MHAKRSPRIDMVLNCHRPRRALALTDGEELLESRGALNGGLVDLGVGVDVVRRAVGDDGAHVRGTGVSSTEVEIVGLFVDVVFDERVG